MDKKLIERILKDNAKECILCHPKTQRDIFQEYGQLANVYQSKDIHENILVVTYIIK